jgi:hypothetical protein
MKYSLGLAVALTLIAAAPAATENAPASKDAPVAHQHRHHNDHRATQPATPVPAAPTGSLHPKLYPESGVNDSDGLSRDPDDCNKGCIGGNPG